MNWRKKLEGARGRILYRSFDAAITAPLRPRQSVGRQLRTILRPRLSNYDRVGGFVNLLDNLLPGTAQMGRRLLYRFDQFPFNGFSIELLAYGTGATVFRLQDGDRDLVLKVFRRSLGRGMDRVMEVAQLYRDKYDAMRSWYRGPYQPVLPARFLILHGPILGRPAAALLQPYVAEKRDFFADFATEELLTLMHDDAQLRRQFIYFAEETLRVYHEIGQCVDFLGRNNLVVVPTNIGHQLRIIDTGIFLVDMLRDQRPTRFQQVEAHMERLEQLLANLVTVTN